jgi:hypothetical protein
MLKMTFPSAVSNREDRDETPLGTRPPSGRRLKPGAVLVREYRGEFSLGVGFLLGYFVRAMISRRRRLDSLAEAKAAFRAACGSAAPGASESTKPTNGCRDRGP